MSNQLENAIKELEGALREYESAKESARSASSRETAALNKLNDAQKKFDAIVDTIREDNAGRGTNWGGS